MSQRPKNSWRIRCSGNFARGLQVRVSVLAERRLGLRNDKSVSLSLKSCRFVEGLSIVRGVMRNSACFGDGEKTVHHQAVTLCVGERVPCSLPPCEWFPFWSSSRLAGGVNFHCTLVRDRVWSKVQEISLLGLLWWYPALLFTSDRACCQEGFIVLFT